MTYEFSMAGALIGLGLAIFLIIKKIQPVYSLVMGALVGGLIGGGGLVGTVETMASGAQDMMSSVLRILTSGVLVGALIKTGSTSRIAKTIVETFGEKRAVWAIAIASMVICAIGVFIPIAVITVAPIAIAIAKRAKLSVWCIFLALVGGGRAGNIISPNPNTIAVAEAFDLNLTSLMARNLIPAVAALLVTVLTATLINKKTEPIGENFFEESDAGKDERNLKGSRNDSDFAENKEADPEDNISFPAAVSGPLVVMGLLILRPLFDINIDPLIALPAGGVVCLLATKKWKMMAETLEFGMGKVVGVCLLLMSTGTLAGIIKASTLQDHMIQLMSAMHMPIFLLAPLSGMLLAAAAASTTAGATIAAQTFASTLLEAGIPAISAGAMINASATIIDCMPHGSFFHASAGAVGMGMKERMKIIPLEACVGLASTAAAMVMYLI